MTGRRYLSVCSGIEAASVAWGPLGWQPVAFSEIDRFPSAVLAHHYPAVPNWGDMTRFQEWPDADVDVLVGGTPCQSFSVAGLRAGLADPRGSLMLTYGAIAGRYRPDWLVWENVPGVLSSNGGRDFGTFLGMLGELGYGFAYRVLDAQFVRTCRFPRAVPQRRRRVFVVGYLGDWRRAAAVLFDGESLRGNPPPRREAGQNPAPTISARPTGGGGLGTDLDLDGGLIPQGFGGGNTSGPIEAAACLTAKGQRIDFEVETFVAHALRGEGFDASEDGTGRGTPLVPVAFDCLAGGNTGLSIGEVPGTLHGGGKSGGRLAVAFDCKGSQVQHDETGASPTLRAMGHTASHPNAGGQLAVAFPSEHMEGRHADAYEADASSALSTLRSAVGAEAYQKWGLGILAALQSSEILQSWLHGGSLRVPTEEGRPRLDDGALSCSEDGPSRALRALWINGPDGRSPQGRGLAKQLAGKPGEALSVLPCEGALPEGDLQNLRSAREGARAVQQALYQMAEVGRSARSQGKPAHAPWAVRRLTPREAERLQGFPDNFTLVPVGNRLAADGPRYKALGNSMAVNVMGWIGARIAKIDQLGARCAEIARAALSGEGET